MLAVLAALAARTVPLSPADRPAEEAAERDIPERQAAGRSSGLGGLGGLDSLGTAPAREATRDTECRQAVRGEGDFTTKNTRPSIPLLLMVIATYFRSFNYYCTFQALNLTIVYIVAICCSFNCGSWSTGVKPPSVRAAARCAKKMKQNACGWLRRRSPVTVHLIGPHCVALPGIAVGQCAAVPRQGARPAGQSEGQGRAGMDEVHRQKQTVVAESAA